MTENPKALLGMHEPEWKAVYTRRLQRQGYEVLTAQTVDEMKSAMGVSEVGRPQNPFQLYMMDANLGFPGADTYDPAKEIFELIRPDFDSGLIKFLAITGNPDVVAGATGEGIPCFNKGKSQEITDYLTN